MFIYVFITGAYGYFDDHIQMYKSTWYSYLYLQFKKPWAIMIIALFIPRFFCKYLCYQKAGYQVINRLFPFFSIRREPETCLSCDLCSKNCPMDIEIAKKETISGGECVGCLSCVDSSGCPSNPSSLYMSWLGIRISPLTLSITVVSLYIIATAVLIFGFNSVH